MGPLVPMWRVCMRAGNRTDHQFTRYVTASCYTVPCINPPPVNQSWDEFFSRTSAGAPPGHVYTSPPTIRPDATCDDPQLIKDHLAVQALIRAYQIRGHNIAKLDPLGINEADLDSSTPLELESPIPTYSRQ